MTIAPRRIVLFGGSRDGLQMDAPVDATTVVVAAFDRSYAMVRAAADQRWLDLAGQTLTYEDSGACNSAGVPIFVLAA